MTGEISEVVRSYHRVTHISKMSELCVFFYVLLQKYIQKKTTSNTDISNMETRRVVEKLCAIPVKVAEHFLGGRTQHNYPPHSLHAICINLLRQ